MPCWENVKICVYNNMRDGFEFCMVIWMKDGNLIDLSYRNWMMIANIHLHLAGAKP